MTFALLAPISNFFGMIWNMTHQIKIVYSIHERNLTPKEIEEKLEILSMPRVLFSIYLCAVNMLYGFELHNYWMLSSSFLGLILTLILTAVIWSVTRKAKSPGPHPDKE